MTDTGRFRAVCNAIRNPGLVTERQSYDHGEGIESPSHWSARAVMEVIEPWLRDADPEARKRDLIERVSAITDEQWREVFAHRPDFRERLRTALVGKIAPERPQGDYCRTHRNAHWNDGDRTCQWEPIADWPAERVEADRAAGGLPS